MEWQDQGIVLAVRRHGESSAIVDLFTRDHGRHGGLVRGGNSRRFRPVLQPGNEVKAEWKARLEDHLGNYTVELARSHTAVLFASPSALEAVQSACALLSLTMAERHAHPQLFDAFKVFLDALEEDRFWPPLLVRWELGLLEELGFGLDLVKCAATGARDGLTHVSPRTGRAVTAGAAEPYLDKLLALPAFLRRGGMAEELGEEVSAADLKAGFVLTGYFLERWALAPHGQALPEARHRLIDRLFAQSN